MGGICACRSVEHCNFMITQEIHATDIGLKARSGMNKGETNDET